MIFGKAEFEPFAPRVHIKWRKALMVGHHNKPIYKCSMMQAIILKSGVICAVETDQRMERLIVRLIASKNNFIIHIMYLHILGGSNSFQDKC